MPAEVSIVIADGGEFTKVSGSEILKREEAAELGRPELPGIEEAAELSWLEILTPEEIAKVSGEKIRVECV